MQSTILQTALTLFLTFFPMLVLAAKTPSTIATWAYALPMAKEGGRVSGITATTDGGIILGGSIDSGVKAPDDCCRGNIHYPAIVKIANEKIQWYNVLPEEGSFATVVPTTDGVFAIGYLGSMSHRGWIVRLDHDGDILWQKQFSGGGVAPFSGNRAITPRVATPSITGDGMVIFGETLFGKRTIFATEIDNTGVMRWQREYEGVEHLMEGAATGDDGYVFLGSGPLQDIGHAVTIVKIGKEGDVLWQKAYGPKQMGFGHAVVPVEGEGFLIGGSRGGIIRTQEQSFLLQLDNAGNLVWHKGYTGSGIKSITKIPEGYILGSYNFKYSVGPPAAMFLEVTKKGKALWAKTFKGSIGFDPLSIFPFDNGYVFAAYSNSLNPKYIWEPILGKTGRKGNIPNLKAKGLRIFNTRVKGVPIKDRLLDAETLVAYDAEFEPEDTNVTFTEGKMTMRKLTK